MARIYVGNLPYTAATADIEEAFGPFGTVRKVDFVIDRETGRPRGFAFVDMDDEGARRAIAELNGTQIGGRAIVVNEARERSPKPRREEHHGRPRRDRDWT